MGHLDGPIYMGKQASHRSSCSGAVKSHNKTTVNWELFAPKKNGFPADPPAFFAPSADSTPFSLSMFVLLRSLFPPPKITPMDRYIKPFFCPSPPQLIENKKSHIKYNIPILGNDSQN